MNEHNALVVARLVQSIDDFVSGTIEIDDIQSRLASSLTLLEMDGSSAYQTLRVAEADVEEIRFTMLQDEQRPAATFRLDDLRATLLEELGRV